MDIYFVQEIDNSRVVRVADPRRRREVRMLLMAVGMLFLLLFAYTWQRYRMVQLGYQTQAARTEQASLEQWNRGLRLEEASLADPNRIYTLAEAQLGMRSAAPDQISVLETLPVNPRNAPVVAASLTRRPALSPLILAAEGTEHQR